MVKRLSIFLSIFFLSWSIVYWQTISWGITNAPSLDSVISPIWKVDSQSNQKSTVKDTKSLIWNSKSVDVFCWIQKLLTTKDKFALKDHLNDIQGVKRVTRKENKRILETYINVYWQVYLQEESVRLKRDISVYDILKVLDWDMKYISQYSTLEQQCLDFRRQDKISSDIIENLYWQVEFFNSYYSTYPKELTKWILPWFIVSFISVFETTLRYLLALVIFNFLFWVIFYMNTNWKEDKKDEKWDKVVQWFWYLLIIWLIKLWVIWTIIGLVWYESIKIMKVFII